MLIQNLLNKMKNKSKTKLIPDKIIHSQNIHYIW